MSGAALYSRKGGQAAGVRVLKWLGRRGWLLRLDDFNHRLGVPWRWLCHTAHAIWWEQLETALTLAAYKQLDVGQQVQVLDESGVVVFEGRIGVIGRSKDTRL